MNERRSFADVFPLDGAAGGRPARGMRSQTLARRDDFRLGAATIRPSLRMVEAPGGKVAAEPRVMQVLLALADADGAVLSRDDLIRICWNGQIVGDDSINRAIGEVRRIARETDAGFGIETIPRIGYRIIVSEATPAAAAGSAVAERPSTSANRRLVLLGGVVAAAGGIGIWASFRPQPDPAEGLIEESQITIRAGTPAAERRAIALLEQAVDVSPGNAKAWGLLALTRARTDEHSTDRATLPAAAVDQAAQRALRLDSGNADAKAALAIAIPYYGDWLAAERRFDAVLAQHPDHLFTRDSRIFFLGAVGRMIESSRNRLATAGNTSFDAGLHYRLVYALWFLGRIAEADRAASRGMEMWPRHPGIWFARLWLLAGTGRYDRALAHIDDGPARPSLPPPMLETLRSAIRAAESRQPAEIDGAVNRVMAGVERSVTAVVNAMMLLNLMGVTDRAFDLARAYYLEQGPIIAAMQWRPGQPVVPDQRRRKTNMLFTPTALAMQQDPRFMPLMEEMGLVDYWRRRGVVPDFMARLRN